MIPDVLVPFVTTVAVITVALRGIQLFYRLAR